MKFLVSKKGRFLWMFALLLCQFPAFADYPITCRAHWEFWAAPTDGLYEKEGVVSFYKGVKITYMSPVNKSVNGLSSAPLLGDGVTRSFNLPQTCSVMVNGVALSCTIPSGNNSCVISLSNAPMSAWGIFTQVPESSGLYCGRAVIPLFGLTLVTNPTCPKGRTTGLAASLLCPFSKSLGATVLNSYVCWPKWWGPDPAEAWERASLAKETLSWNYQQGPLPPTVTAPELPIQYDLIARDEFEREDSSSLSNESTGIEWVANLGTTSISSNRAVASSPGISVTTLSKLIASDVSMSADIVAAPQSCPGLAARYKGPGDSNMYLAALCNWNGVNYIQVNKNIKSVWTQIGTNMAVSSSKGRVRLETIGNLIVVYFNNTMVFSATDNSIIAPGLSGLRTNGATSSYDNFLVTAVKPPNLPFEDSFNRSDFSSLGTAWVTYLGETKISSNRAVATVGGPSVEIVSGLSASDVSVSAEVDAPAQTCPGVIARYAGPGDSNMYLAALCNYNTARYVQVFKNVGGAWTQIGTNLNVSSAKGTLKLDTIGSLIAVYLDDKQIAAFADSSIKGPGSVGIRSNGAAGSAYDNFAVQAKTTPPPPTFPFSDNFDRNDLPLLGGVWATQVGSTQIISNRAVANVNGPSIEVLSGTSITDVSVFADVDAAAQTCPGVIARYSGPGDSNMYLAALCKYNSTLYVQVYKSVAGTWTQLGNNIPVLSAKGKLRLDTIGSQITVFFNDKQIAVFSDWSIKGPGSVGIRSNGASGSAYDNFGVIVKSN